MKKASKFLMFVLLLLSAAIFITNCGGGGGDKESSTPAPAPTTCANVAGTWNTVEQVDGTACGEGNFTENNTYNVAQNGCNLTVTDGSGNTFTGSINGNSGTWSGSFPEDGGTTTINSLSLTVSADGNSFSGSSSWTWVGTNSSCSGTTNSTGTKAPSGNTSPQPAPQPSPPPTGDTTPPAVTSTIPVDNATNVEINSPVTVTFSEAMDTSTINSSTFTLTSSSGTTQSLKKAAAVTGTISYDASSKTATFTPSTNLSYSTTYTATVTNGVKDIAGNAMASNKTWSFTTKAVNISTAVVGAWQGTAKCGNSNVEFAWFICPMGRLRGYEKFDQFNYLDCGTWTVSDDVLTADYKWTAVIDPTVTGNENQKYQYINDTLNHMEGCPMTLNRLVGQVTEEDCTSITCSAGGSGTITGCGTDCDCGHCWYCDNGTCRYGGEGQYGCYRGCPF